MPWWVWTIVVWGVAGPLLGALIGQVIKKADERR